MTGISKTTLLFYGTIKLVFIALFSLSIIFSANSPANAREEIVCKGSDIVAELAKSNPEKLAELRAQAAKEKYGDARLWKISKPGLPDSWVFGTMHMSGKRISTMPPVVQKAFDRSQTVMVEIIDMLDRKKATKIVMGLKHLTFRLDGTTIESDITAEQMEKVKAAIKARALPYELTIRMQPWMLAPSITTQLCEIEAKRKGNEILDSKIANLALKNGKKLIGLETTKEQMTLIASMPHSYQVKSLVDSLKLGDVLDDIKQTMKSLYVKGEIAMIIPLIRHVSQSLASGPEFEEFQQKIVVERNKNMIKRAGDHFAKGKAFMAVGALHLPGDDGVVALLVENGYSVEAVRNLEIAQ